MRKISAYLIQFILIAVILTAVAASRHKKQVDHQHSSDNHRDISKVNTDKEEAVHPTAISNTPLFTSLDKSPSNNSGAKVDTAKSAASTVTSQATTVAKPKPLKKTKNETSEVASSSHINNVVNAESKPRLVKKTGNGTTPKLIDQLIQEKEKDQQNKNKNEPLIPHLPGKSKVEKELKKLTKEEIITEVEESTTKHVGKEEKLKAKENKIEVKIEHLKEIASNTANTVNKINNISNKSENTTKSLKLKPKPKPGPSNETAPAAVPPVEKAPPTAAAQTIQVKNPPSEKADKASVQQIKNEAHPFQSNQQPGNIKEVKPKRAPSVRGNHTTPGSRPPHHHNTTTHQHHEVTPSTAVHKFNRKLIPDEQLDALNDILFPNRAHKLMRRKLGIEKAAYNGSVPCVICRDLTTCSILNGYQIEEVYYPKNLNYLETCKVIESFGQRIEKLVFGNGKTFRDTSQCREMVMQYLCLFYGSDNDMYKNYCIYQEDVKDPNPANHKVAPRPPCKSFCVQIASVCANDPDFFIQTCNNIKCPPTQDECTPDPTLKNKVLAANLGCAVPYYNSPYFRSAAVGSFQLSTSLVLLVPILMYQLLFPH